jgi:hypothetical protein
MLIMQDVGGAHNADLVKTQARLLKGASWKKQRVVVILPAAASIPAKVALSHWNLAFPPNQGVVRILAQGMEVGDAYSQAIQSVLDHPDLGAWEYLLTLEHDNMPPADGVLRLIQQMEAHPEYTCIGGLYFTKGEGGVAQIWGDPRDPQLNFRPQVPDPNGGLVECCGTGMGFNLWRLQTFRDERLRKPWFKTDAGCTQDLYAWTDFKRHGYRCAIDCSVKVGHYDLEGKFGPPDFVW